MPIIHLPETDSTNRWLRDHADDFSSEELTVVWTDHQTAGRGCGTNTWESERGKNLLFSMLFRPKEIRASEQFILSMANALALREINQDKFLSDAPNPVSLRQVLGQDTDCNEVLQKVLGNFAKYMEMVRTGCWEIIRTSYRNHLYRLEETWPYRFADGSVKDCKLVNVSDDGHLELLHDNREVYRMAFKEVQFVI